MAKLKVSLHPVSPELYDALLKLVELLGRDYGVDFAFKILGQGHVIAESTVDQVVAPTKKDVN